MSFLEDIVNRVSFFLSDDSEKNADSPLAVSTEVRPNNQFLRYEELVAAKAKIIKQTRSQSEIEVDYNDNGLNPTACGMMDAFFGVSYDIARKRNIEQPSSFNEQVVKQSLFALSKKIDKHALCKVYLPS